MSDSDLSASTGLLGPLPRDTVRGIFLSSGFEIKPGHEDLKPYVYAAAERLMSEAVAAERKRTITECIAHIDTIDDGDQPAYRHCQEALAELLAEHPDDRRVAVRLERRVMQL